MSHWLAIFALAGLALAVEVHIAVIERQWADDAAGPCRAWWE